MKITILIQQLNWHQNAKWHTQGHMDDDDDDDAKKETRILILTKMVNSKKYD